MCHDPLQLADPPAMIFSIHPYEQLLSQATISRARLTVGTRKSSLRIMKIIWASKIISSRLDPTRLCPLPRLQMSNLVPALNFANLRVDSMMIYWRQVIVQLTEIGNCFLRPVLTQRRALEAISTFHNFSHA